VAGKNLSHPREAYILAAIVYFVICFTCRGWSSAAGQDRHHSLKDSP
jgi:ABC-type amino acid transport system permease subunit